MIILGRLAIGGLAMLATSAMAHAEWRYCLAASDVSRQVFLSDTFISDDTHDALMTVFQKALIEAGTATDSVQCPRAASESQLEDMRAHAVRFNKEFFGRTTIEFHWRPTSNLQAHGRPAIK